jgi:hypothetical protein
MYILVYILLNQIWDKFGNGVGGGGDVCCTRKFVWVYNTKMLMNTQAILFLICL